MPKECAAVNCKERGTKQSPYSFHSFPTNPEKKKVWTVKMNRYDPVSKKLWEPKPHDALCSKHFEPGCFTDRSRLSTEMGIEYKPRLKPDAVPTIFHHKRKEEVPERGAAMKRRKREILDQALQEVETEEGEEITDNQMGAQPVDFPTEEPSSKDIQVQFDFISQETRSVKCQTAMVPISVCARAVQATCVTTDSSVQTESNKTTSETKTEEPRLEILDEEEMEDEAGESSESESGDKCTNTHSSSERLTEDLHYRNPCKEKKYIVFEEELKELLNCGRSCQKPCQVTKKECGTAVEFLCTCFCGHKFTWQSQPSSYKLPLGNLVFAAAAFFTACSPTRLITCFKEAGIAVFSSTTFFHIQAAYLVPSVTSVWQNCQQRLFAARAGKTIKLAGDGRCDSPGHTAKYGSYSLMDANTSEVLHVELIQSNQVKNSHAMELAGLKNALQVLKRHLSISNLITDRHASIKKYMRDEQPDIKHNFDIWHMVKGVTKKLEGISKSKTNANIALWTKSIAHHMYWCSVSTKEDEEDRNTVVKEKWLSVLNHIADIHEGHGDKFQRCQHEETEPKAWIKKGTRQHRMLEKIVASKFLLRDVGQLSPDVQTASLESYHAVVCHFAPKLNHFTFLVMQAKLFLAAMHFNANAEREQATTKDGEMQWKIARPRANKGIPVAKALKGKVTREYTTELFDTVIELRLAYPSYKRAKAAPSGEAAHVPEFLSTTAGPVNKQAVIDQHFSRFAQ